MQDKHLRAHLRDGKHLRDFALQEFISAARTGRVIAFVGSYATEDMGYPNWKEFLADYSKLFKNPVSAASRYIDLANHKISPPPTPPGAPASEPPPTASSKTALIDLVVEHRLSQFTDPKDAEDLLQHNKAELCKSDFFGLGRAMGRPVTASAPYEVVESLGINRIITTNYDLEFEWQLMLTAEEHEAGDKDRSAKFAKLVAEGKIVRDGDTRALSRRLPSGRTTHSDLFDRGRTDRLIEFAVGAPDHYGHVLHLHGRATADDHDRLIVGLGDYERQYRRSGIAKVPFEHALKLLYAGNPVIFVGNGMAEPEVTNTLENFVSDNLRNRLAPAFVLWSPNVTELDFKKIELGPEDELRRIEWYRRFGVLTIYDCDLKGFFNRRTAARDKGAQRPIALPRRVSHAVKALGAYGKEHIPHFKWEREHLRSAQVRYTGIGAPSGADQMRFDVWRCEPLIDDEDELVDILQVEPPGGTARFFNQASDADHFHTLFRGAPVKAIIDHPGVGHGYLAKVIADAFSNTRKLKKVGIDVAASVVNSGFICEIDSTFALVSGLFDGETAFGSIGLTTQGQKPEPKSRQAALLDYEDKLLKQMSGGQLDRHLLLVINGMDRFFDTSGYPLSNELDNMMRRIAQAYRRTYEIQGQQRTIHEWVEALDTVNPYTVILLGTPRVQRYLEGLDWKRQTMENAKTRYPGDYAIISNRDSGPGKALLDDIKLRNLNLWKGRTEDLSRIFQCEPGEPHSNYLALLQRRMTIDLSSARQARMERGRARGVGDLRHGILEAYLRSDSIREALGAHMLDESLADLCLDILSSLSFFGQPIDRCVFDELPRVKKRFPRGTARRDKVKDAVDALGKLGLMLEFPAFPGTPTGGFRYGIHRTVMAELRNRYGVPISDAKLSAGFNLSLFASQLIDDYTPEQDIHCDLGEMVDSLIDACKVRAKKASMAGTVEPGAYLRAAMLLMRNYFTTSALLMLEPSPDAHEDLKAPMTQHAERLEGLIKTGEMLARQRSKLKAVEGAEAFFPDDLVWLHNELGVVKLVQGDLYKARFAFEAAETINRAHVEFDDRLQNWRRLQLNQLQLDIERSKISRAESRILELERAVNEHVAAYQLGEPPSAGITTLTLQPAGPGADSISAVERIIEHYGNRPHERIRVVDPQFPADAILTVGLLAGYRGFCGYLRGNFKAAIRQLDVAVEILRNIGEQRGYSIFLRYRAALLNSMKSTKKSDDSLRIGLAAADSVRQMDVAYLYRVDEVAHANLAGRISANEYPATLQKIMAALHYSVRADIYRVRIEARQTLAEMRFSAGDYDSALEHAADALAVATRFGFGLRKISLRIMIGRILLKRNDPKSGNALLNQAIVSADRVGFQRAVERAQAVRYEYSQLYRA